MRRLTARAALLLLAAFSLPRPGGAQPEIIASDAATAARVAAHAHTRERLTSIQGDIVTRTYAPRAQTIGRIVLRGEDAYDWVGYLDEAGEHVSQETVITRDAYWSYHHILQVATHVDRARLRDAGVAAAVPNPASSLIDIFDKAAPGSVQYLGPVTENGETLDRFRIVAPVGGGAPGTLFVWMHPEDGVLRRMELHSGSGRLLLERRLVNVKVNAPIPDGVFELQIPDDVEVHDLTDEYLKRSESTVEAR